MIEATTYQGQMVAILGLGRSGLSVAHALKAGGANPICWDDCTASREKAEQNGFELRNLNRDDVWDDIDLLVMSPGIPHLYPNPHQVVKNAWKAGIPVDNDIGLFFKEMLAFDDASLEVQPRVICVTGSNGKSTTTALIDHVFKQAAVPVQMGGNIGRGVFDLDPPSDGEVYVLELSSYQTELARTLAPDVAVFMNLSKDHLDRHNGMGGYFAAKARLFTVGSPVKSIIGVDELEGQFLANQLRESKIKSGNVITISSGRKLQGDGWSIFARKGFLSEWRKGRQVASVDLRDIEGLPGEHNHQNACAAYAAARSLGLNPKQVEAGLRTYPGLPHRAQVIAKSNGIIFVNDSKATNVDAACNALKAFKNIRWIAGGQAKEDGILELEPLFDSIKKSYLIGESGPLFSSQLNKHPHEVCETLEKAVLAAIRDAKTGDTILLAPAAASFDQFNSFEERGNLFESLVKDAIKA